MSAALPGVALKRAVSRRKGADVSLAQNLLEACDNNLEMAINMHMEGAVDSGSTQVAGPASMKFLQATEEVAVRAPIPQKQEVLVEGPDEIAFSFRGRRRTVRSVFDKFRDFEAETKRQEEELLANSQEAEAEGEASTSNSCSSSSSNSSLLASARSRSKTKTLEDLFRPPLDLIYRGTFQAARDCGVAKKRWLMVNIQDASEFPCQVLNRDVWSNAAVKTIVKEHFIFWQDLNDSILEADEASQIEAAIKASLVEADSERSSPAACEADEANQVESDSLETFDSDHEDIDYSLGQKRNPERIFNGENSLFRREVSAAEEKEDMKSCPSEKKSSDSESMSINNETDWKSYLGPADDPESKLMLRLPDGTRDIVSMPSSSKLMALVKYVCSKGYNSEQYELVTNFPRREISQMDFNITLEDAGLFPQEAVFIQAR
ncbi:UBX domain-containing protein 7-like isoform X2 [Portunus trituberculatus]|uniref:UBX domain-containing protein 7-like isoform X2 n=1 Tax=Portunus trituberculatus TaxID=210409 RepID=UPI001E1CB3CB|nr:UBX domain-containing protein 7-like isoform X2 [Portunus trituberculatus]